MAEALSTSLLITAIGMSLVFLMLILLWGLMALMVRLFSDAPAKETAVAEVKVPETPVTEPTAPVTSDVRRRAAAAAVAAALSLGGSNRPQAGIGLFAPPATQSLSAWQTAQRANQMRSKSTRGSAQ